MRVLYFTRDYTPHDYRFLNALVGSDHQVFSLRLERSGRQLEDRSVPDRVEQIIWKGGQKPARWQDGWALRRDLRRVLGKVKPDVVHAGSIQTAAFLTALTGYHPLVSMSWGSDLLKDAERNVWWQRATHFTLKHTDVLVGDCQAVKDKAVEMGFPAEHVILFPWGVDLQHFTPDAGETSSSFALRKRLGWEDAFVVLSSRSWEPIYGVDVLVSAFVLAAQQIPALRLILLGNGSQAGRIHHILRNGGMQDRVTYAGQAAFSDLPGYYNAADLYVSASHSDGSSVSLMEALACGSPVLLSDIPGNLEWITHGEQGWFFEDGNIESCAHGMVSAFEQKEHLSKTGVSARQLAEARADWGKNFQQLLKAYELAYKIAHKRP